MRKIVISCPAFLTLVHRSSSSVLGKLCLPFVLKVSLRIGLFSTESCAEKILNKMHSVTLNFKGLTDQNKDLGLLSYVLAQLALLMHITLATCQGDETNYLHGGVIVSNYFKRAN